ncbi:MAG TPA: hypothetical protein VIX86_11390 [Streptosporangiaceae bacterium]
MMDRIGWFIATLHQLLGHEKTAAVIGMPSGNTDACVLCRHERSPDDLTRQAVIRALSPPGKA